MVQGEVSGAFPSMAETAKQGDKEDYHADKTAKSKALRWEGALINTVAANELEMNGRSFSKCLLH